MARLTRKQKGVLARAIMHGTGLSVVFIIAWGIVWIYLTDPVVFWWIFGVLAIFLILVVQVWAYTENT